MHEMPRQVISSTLETILDISRNYKRKSCMLIHPRKYVC